MGRRVIVVEGAERWREADVEEHLAPALAAMPPDTTLAFFAREEARAKAPQALHRAVEKAGGQIVAQTTVKQWELPKWAREQAPRLGLLARRGGRESARRPGRRAPAAAAARAREARAGRRRCRRRRAAHRDGRGDRGARRAPRRSGGRTRSADALVAGDAPARSRPTAAARAGRARRPGSPTGWPRGCARRSRRPSSSRGTLARRTSKRALRMPPKAAERLISRRAAQRPRRGCGGALGDAGATRARLRAGRRARRATVTSRRRKSDEDDARDARDRG